MVNEVVAPLSSVRGVLGLMLPFAPAIGVATYVGICVNDAMTVQFTLTESVVNVVPASEPPHVPPTAVEKPVLGVTVNERVVPPPAMTGVVGLMVPCAPAEGVI